MEFAGHPMLDGNLAVSEFGDLRCVADGVIEHVFTARGSSAMSAEFGNCVVVREAGDVWRIYHHLFEHPGRAIGDAILADQRIGELAFMPPEPAPKRTRK